MKRTDKFNQNAATYKGLFKFWLKHCIQSIKSHCLRPRPLRCRPRCVRSLMSMRSHIKTCVRVWPYVFSCFDIIVKDSRAFLIYNITRLRLCFCIWRNNAWNCSVCRLTSVAAILLSCFDSDFALSSERGELHSCFRQQSNERDKWEVGLSSGDDSQYLCYY